MDNFVNIVIILFALISSLQFFRQKWLFLIAGYNTMSQKEKEQYNISMLTKIMGSECLFIALMLLVDMFLPKSSMLTTVLILISVVITVVLGNTIAKKSVI